MRLLIVVCVLLSSICTATSFAETDRPNFVLCMADDQGWGDVGFNGHPHLKTPIMDLLAHTALRFDRFHAAAPVCSPTRASFLTGRHPNRLGVFSWGHTLRPQEVTLAEVLQQAGYATGHFGKWHLGSVRPDSPVNPGNSGFDEWVSSPNFYENSPLLSHNGKVIETDGESSMITVEAALPFMKQAIENQQPFLAVIWFGNPHTPHQAQEHLRDLYPNLTKAEQNYFGEITGIDNALGRLREKLKQLGVRDNTLLWYTSDNGPQGRTVASSGGLKGVKGSLWEGGTRVPSMIEWPDRIKEHRVSEVPASTSDIYPTVLQLAGVKSPHNHPLDGISLVDVIDGKQHSRNKPMAFWVYTSRGVGTPSAELMQKFQDEQAGRLPATSAPELSATALMKVHYEHGDLGGHSAIVDENWKLHAIPNKQGKLQFEFYDLGNDAAETNNIATDHPDRVKKLAAKLSDWRESVIDSLNGEDYQ